MSAKLVSRIFIFIVLFSAFSAFAYADDCVALGGSIVGAECQISSNVNKVGSYTIDETLHILAGKTINASNDTNIGIDLTIDGNLLMDLGSRIYANDELGVPNEDASPITLDVQGDLEMNDKSGIFAENIRSGGDGGNIGIETGGNILMKSGSNISSSDKAGGNPGGQPVAGNITITSGGNFVAETNTVIATANAAGKAGHIRIEADGTVNIDGLVSVGPSTDVLSSKLTGFILARGKTKNKARTITIISNSQDEPGVTIGTNAILVSQGEDPGVDKILLQGCGIDVNGLVGTVAQKSHLNDSSGVSVPGIITLRSGTTININGQDLGDVGSAQARIRADDITGEKPKLRRVDLFANGKITVNGALSGDVFTVTSNGGSATNQFGGTISAISLQDAILSSALAFQAKAFSESGGSDGGRINLSAKTSVDIDTTSISAFGNNPSNGFGGKIDAKSYSSDISWFSGMGDVRPTGDGVADANRGTVNLTACTVVDVLGTLFPSSGNPTVPGILTSVCSPSAPSLPSGEDPLPVCEPRNEIPEFTTIGAALVLAGAGFYIYRKRKK